MNFLCSPYFQQMLSQMRRGKKKVQVKEKGRTRLEAWLWKDSERDFWRDNKGQIWGRGGRRGDEGVGEITATFIRLTILAEKPEFVDESQYAPSQGFTQIQVFPGKWSQHFKTTCWLRLMKTQNRKVTSEAGVLIYPLCVPFLHKKIHQISAHVSACRWEQDKSWQ